jgi:uncharacterized alkaline shock family protein YloU
MGSGRGLPPPAERGATVIPERVVARLAARAAREALARQLGAPPAHRGLAVPRASATTGKDSARLGVSLDLPYPIDITRASRQIRQDIAERVAQLTGLHVGEVTLTVLRLVPDGGLESGRVS